MPNTRQPVPPPDGPLVAVLAYDGLCTFEFGVACEIFGLPRPEMNGRWYRFVVCAADAGPLRAAGGLTFSAPRGLAALARADLIVVPGWRAIDAPVPAPLLEALRRANRRGARILSFCSGIAVLAAAGLLAGRRATTHWRYARAMAERFPDIEVDATVLYVDEGAVLTSAGTAAAIDLCLHVIRKDFGTAAANSVARRLVVSPHRDGGQAQFIESPVQRDRDAARLGPLMEWIRRRLAQPHPVDALAQRAGMSVRTFQRRFQAATGHSPGDWLVIERLRAARELLERHRPAPMDDIAAASGFGSPETMRHHFRRRLGISPGEYRRRFAAAPA